MNKADSSGTSDRFNSLRWHDSKMRGFSVLHKGDHDAVVIELELRKTSEYEFARTILTLQNAVFVFCDIDLQGKRECSDDISSAKCAAKTTLMDKLQSARLKYSPDALDGYFQFSFFLIPPGGSLDVIASDFTLEAQTELSDFGEASQSSAS